MNEMETMLEMLGGRERTPRTLAVVGLSDDPGKASHGVSAYMQAHGYRILPVNPGIEERAGGEELCVAERAAGEAGRGECVSAAEVPSGDCGRDAGAGVDRFMGAAGDMERRGGGEGGGWRDPGW